MRKKERTKKNPVKNINAPTYPTLEQLKVGGPKHPISKIAAVTALTAAMALAAGCGEENVKRKAGSFLGKHIDETEETYQLMGDTTTETTPWELDGETTPWELDGVAQADPTEDYVLSGGESVRQSPTGNPWVFSEIRAALSGDPDVKKGDFTPDRKTKAEVIRRHLLGLCEDLGEKTGVKEMRSQIACYLKGGRGTAEIKNRLMTANTIPEVEALLEEYASAE